MPIVSIAIGLELPASPSGSTFIIVLLSESLTLKPSSPSSSTLFPVTADFKKNVPSDFKLTTGSSDLYTDIPVLSIAVLVPVEEDLIWNDVGPIETTPEPLFPIVKPSLVNLTVLSTLTAEPVIPD